ncbi:hypothetical protein [Vreelandella zhaodongensis]|uniref:Uncharacterized protein n=1 Tax=Vreelandella zhaodongensis TaxID=1176240 RepID=A0ABX2SSJ3_VREZH|nr:hypothetical protein [Halomonas zhaodongensis]NYS45020.1 hypothetical protein [Halomonas zhaodongensis]
MKDIYQTSMTDLYSSTSFGGGGGNAAGGNTMGSTHGSRSRPYGGPGGGSDPGNLGGVNAPSRGPVTSGQEQAVKTGAMTVAGGHLSRTAGAAWGFGTSFF